MLHPLQVADRLKEGLAEAVAIPPIIGATDSGVLTTFQVVRSGTGITAGVEAASVSTSTLTAVTGTGTVAHADNGYIR